MTTNETRRTEEDMVAELRALVPQMREDAEIHRTWTTEAAKADYAKPSARPLVDHVGDAEWHTKWADFYDRAARVMGSAADAVESHDAEILRLSAHLAGAEELAQVRADQLAEQSAEVERLRARVAEYDKDTQRLDHIEEECLLVARRSVSGHNLDGSEQDADWWQVGASGAETLRAAIDAAIAASLAPEEGATT